ncbi:PREDICTED: transcription factor bHLH129-like [Tarenaya hassleriana]|uniref:transcription factor bHLH129-like n=1 Tax=Tarenaya hassleriana TaxID=28532 RepID=UPI00053C1009|nr:PREDICTED: transcription factor bHLH129-like [Tarenaya hassleriana]
MYPSPPSPPSPPHNSDVSGERSRYGSAVGTTRDLSSLGSQFPPPPPPQQQHRSNVVGHYLAGDYYSSSFGSDSGNCNVMAGSSIYQKDSGKNVMQSTSGFNDQMEGDSNGGGGASSSSLFRHRSSPPGFFNQQISSTDRNGFSLGGRGGGGDRRLPSRSKAEVGFPAASGQDRRSLSRIPEVVETTAVNAGVNAASGSSCMSFGMDNRRHHSWDASSSSNISFTIDQPGKRSKTTDFFTLETQFSMPQTSLEIERMKNLMNIPEDSVPCRVRAKRGCATHPRSIAERERRTRISGKLKKLQELVPNMDKQTSYADMLDLAVEHIKELQHQVEKLIKEAEKCNCGACKR